MSNLEERSGGVVIRLGGNTQEYASMVDSLPKGATFSKSAFTSNQTVSSLAMFPESILIVLSIFTDPDAGCFVHDRYVLHDC